MNKQVWIFQYKKEVEQKGAAKASWYVGWYDLAGKRHAESCGPGSRGKNKAEKRQRRIQSELDTGIHQPNNRKKWSDFEKEYEEKILSRLAVKTQLEAKVSLKHFQRLAKPAQIVGITTQTIDDFVSKRGKERGRKPKSTISPATINKDLRHIKAALRIAADWGYLPDLPKIRMVREPEKLPVYVTPEHFEKIYADACPQAKLPNVAGETYSPSDWWRALFVTAYMTGMRIREILAVKRQDLDLDGGYLITRAADNKGNRDEKLKLHEVVVEHVRQLVSQHPLVFRWPHDTRTLWDESGRIQKLAGINLPCGDAHEHTPSCHVYGFHDFRRAFATVNAPRMKPEALQKLMRHKSYKTTLSYVNLANQVEDAVADMPVPNVLKIRTAEKPDSGEPKN